MYFALILAFAASQSQTVVLTATDSKSIASGTGEDFNDNVLRAYWNNPAQGYVDGLVKFDLSSIPNNRSITALTLRVYHQATSGSPFADPSVAIYRTGSDAWARNQNDIVPSVDQQLTKAMTGFPAGDLVAVDFVLNVSAVNWSGDLIDNTLSLLLRDTAGAVGRSSYVYFYGSDAIPAPPTLTVTYSTNPGLSVTNLRHNLIAIFQVYNARPGAASSVVLSRNGAGPGVLNTGPCGAVTFNLTPNLILLGTATNNGTGTATITIMIPIGAAGQNVWIQGIDFGTCKLTDLFIGVVS